MTRGQLLLAGYLEGTSNDITIFKSAEVTRASVDRHHRSAAFFDISLQFSFVAVGRQLVAYSNKSHCLSYMFLSRLADLLLSNRSSSWRHYRGQFNVLNNVRDIYALFLSSTCLHIQILSEMNGALRRFPTAGI